MKKNLKKGLLALSVLAGTLMLGACAVMSQSKFGRHPQADELEQVQQSPHYVDGEFRNQIPTPMFTDDSTVVSVLLKNLFTAKERPAPKKPIPSVKTDLHALKTRQRMWSSGWGILRIMSSLAASAS